MISFSFKLTDPEANQTLDVVADARDVYVWEKVNKGNKSLNSLLENRLITDFYEIAHVAAKRLRLTDSSLDDFAARYVLDIETDTTEESEADPTPPEA